MQVLTLGLSRCATSSLQAALESDVLNFSPCMHMSHVYPHPDRSQTILDAMHEPEGSPQRQKLLHHIFDGFAGTCDFPGWIFAPDLMDMYPEAPVILNRRRQSSTWAKSARTALSFFGTSPYYAVGFLWKTDRIHYALHRRAYAVAREKFGLDSIYTTEFYDTHNEWVRTEAAKRGRPILEWTAEDGWGPLCKFLGKPEPKDGRPFPHLNEAKTMVMMQRFLTARGAISWVATIAAIGGACYYLWSAYL